MKKAMSFILMYICGIAAFGQDLGGQIAEVLRGKRALVGVAVIKGDRELTVANGHKYPLMSVFKFHVALATLKKMETDSISLDSVACIKPELMHKDTYSPLGDKYPGQSIHISYRDMMAYMVAQSDNNVCDWLIAFAGGIRRVEAYIKSLGITDLNLTETESDMHADIMRCYDNWSTPLATAQLLKKLYEEHILSDGHSAFLEQLMLDCSTGADKLKAGLPDGVRLGHKTGHSDRIPDNVQIGDTDAGVVYLPGGGKCYIVILIKNSRDSDRDNAAIMAEIMDTTYKNITGGVF